jgi:saccharopine dehydrogenase-like NADP-dependent oxidoreductase
MTDEQVAEQVKAADAALRETLTRLIRDEGVAPVSVVIVLAHLLGEIAVDDAATHHGVHYADAALGPVLRQVRQAGRTRAEARRAGKVVRPGHA